MKTALITGGAKRIGRAISLMLAEMGYAVVVTYKRSVTEAGELKKEIVENGGVCEIRKLDLSVPEKLGAEVDTIFIEFPEIVLIVNNASIFEKCEFRNSSLDDLDANFAVHLRSPYVIVKKFANFADKGQVVNILDTRISRNQTIYFPYLLSKKSLADFTQMAAAVLGPGIRVNAIAPGLILPPDGEDDSCLERFASRVPAGRKGDIKDVLSGMRFLVENKYVTGQIIYTDGGEHLM